MAKRIVVALGGNALGANLPEQMEAVKTTSKAIVDLIEEGNEVVVVHGNGPQVGMIANAMAELTRSNPQKYIPCPLSVCGAMSQGYIGYDLQNALREEMLDRNIDKGVATVLTQVEVAADDPAFADPVKPIGPWMSETEAKELEADRGYQFIHDEKQGFRRVVASPKPVNIVELDTIKSLVESNHVVISCGGGTPMRECNVVEMKKNGRVVLLAAKPETILDRVKDNHDRPLIENNKTVSFIADLMEKRRAKYEAAADIIIETDGKNELEICEELVHRLRTIDEEK